MDFFQFRAMNTDIILTAEGPDDQVVPGFQQVKTWIQSSEQRFTRFSEQSELSRLNQSAGSWFAASPDLYEVVTLAHQYVERTAGLFDPSILPALKSAGYDRSMEELRQFGSGSEFSPWFWQPGGFAAARFDDTIKAIYLPPGVQIDLGGIAKGWIAQQAALLLSAYAEVCAVSAGGDMAFIGLPHNETAWEVALEDPRDPTVDIAVLRVRSGAVATSAITKRRWTQAGQARHHIIDPRTGQPAITDWLSVTAVASTAAAAEVYAKALLIAGSQRSISLAESEPGLEFIGVKQDGTLWGSPRSQELIRGTTKIKS